ncbi:ABC-F family ATP-binding cassette domain-containing protein [Enterococcus asini]|uniref:ABC-F family ATP-binding cassette domain-containing protein n=1 Tax=Enterococcus asini TaxID=57732 RepID=UPI001E566126|nr:ABC-F family ATP-binding cassette domain-containing protein [Enterococcus asini]MCD5029889.1 ABC-F family ATP-binding cassette domain-containing protein [Enterococcus asini]MDT2764593.1 ABC-F family ATP-binding cassette domain-containing protein [Enterococcus asini]
MQELKVIGLTKTYGEKTLFQDISFLIHEKDRIGLIGVNGTGKSSLLKILAELDAGDGDVAYIQKAGDYQIGYLTQETDFPEELTVLESVFQGDAPMIQTVRRYEQALLALAEAGDNPENQKAYARAEEAMNEQDAWLVDTNAKTILQKLGITQINQKIKELSGGQKKRVGLAQVLIQEPDLLLLDEPTNHLDYQAIQWLEGYLRQYRGALLMVTHDRYFLDRVTNRIFELSHGQLIEYKGNYEDYVVAKAERERQAIQQEEKRQQLYKQELAWMRAGAKARTTKQQARIHRFEDLKENLNQVQTDEQVAMELTTKRLGKQVLEIKEGNYRFDEKVILKNFDLLVQARDRIGITGENGAGKSTLLNILAGQLALDSGTLIVGETVRIAYYTQLTEPIKEDQRVIAYLQEVAEEAKQKDGTSISVAELLERFLFPRHTHGSLISKLSGGERRRLFLLKLLISQPNVLLLDEPTNDLDIATLTVLEDYLQNFPGAVITVSHDRYFLDKVAEKLLIFEGQGEIDRYYGSIMDYLEKAPEVTPEVAKPTPVKSVEPTAPAANKPKQKLTYMEQKEWATIEDEIADLETQVETLTAGMNNQGSDFAKLQELQNQLNTVETQLEEKMNRWEYLSEFAED